MPVEVLTRAVKEKSYRMVGGGVVWVWGCLCVDWSEEVSLESEAETC